MSEEVYFYEEDQVDPQLKLMASYGITASVARLRQTAPSITNAELNTCMAITSGIGKETGVGYDIYTSDYQNDTSLDSLGGFTSGGNPFVSIESGIDADYFSSYSANVRSIFPTMTTALLMGAWVADVDNDRITGFLNSAFSGASLLFGFGPNANIFSDSQITTLMASNFSGAMADVVANSSNDQEVNKIYFRLYDVENSFTSDIDTKRIKDSAIQYYSVSGDFLYDNLTWSGDGECTDLSVPIFAGDDFEIITDRIELGPDSSRCINFDTHYKPITGSHFYRKFADGPYSSGDYTSTISELYQEYDKDLQQYYEYSDNRIKLVDFQGKAYSNNGAIPIDVPQGIYCAAYERELNERPSNNQRIKLHLGNTGLRTGQTLSGFRLSTELNPFDIFSTPVGVYRTISGYQTGLKFIPITLNPTYWSGQEIAHNAMNPATPDGRVYQNALNFNPNHVRDFYDEKTETYFGPFFRDISEISGIAGPPQRDWVSDFPFIVVTQNFQSETSEQYANLNFGFGASMTEANATVIKGIPAERITKNIVHTTGMEQGFQFGGYTSPDEPDQTTVPFGLTISGGDLDHNNSGENHIKSLAFGMGNGMDGGTLSGTYVVNNAGWAHTGYIYTGVNGVTTTGMDLLGNFLIVSGYSGLGKSYYSTGLIDNFDNVNIVGARGAHLSGALIGSPKRRDKMLVAWTHPTYGHVPISKMYTYTTGIGSGISRSHAYSGFDAGLTNGTTDPTGVFPVIPPESGFAANPTGFTNGLLGSGWYPVFKEQHRENGFPRYYRGPYATSEVKFLYNNAKDMFTGHTGYVAPNSKLTSEPNDGDVPFYDENGERYTLPSGQYPLNGFNYPVGFPHQVVFEIEVEEYATKEFYQRRNWSEFQVPFFSDFSVSGINPSLPEITWSTTNQVIATNEVDSGYASPIAGPLGESNTFHMGHTGVNPLVYDSVPNYIHGNLNDEVGLWSGTSTQASVKTWPENFKDVTGGYIVRWQPTLNGSSTGDAITKNPDANHYLYKKTTRTVTGFYTPPGWKMRTNKFDPWYARRVFTGEVQNIWNQGLSGDLFGYDGSDPLFYERVGGFSGSGLFPNSIDDPVAVYGGSHSQDMVGDSWLSFTFDRQPNSDPYGADYGYGVDEVNDIYWDFYRAPERDKEVLLVDLKSTGLAVYFTALNYFPNSGRLGVTGFSDAFQFFKSGVKTQFEEGNLFDINNQTFSYTGMMHTGSTFRKPFGPDWSGTVSGGNTVYPTVGYWNTWHTGHENFWRRQSRVDITIKNVTWTGHGIAPFDVDYNVQPTGSCRVTGFLKYENLAEQPIYSEGLVLRDSTQNDIVKDYGAYPVAISNTMKEHGATISTQPNEVVETAPSRQVQLGESGARLISDTSEFNKINTQEKNYNKYKIPATSDYTYLNVGTMPSYEGSPLADHQLFDDLTLLYSAQQGQIIEDDRKNPTVIKEYTVEDQKQYYDGVVTDATKDDRFVTNLRPIDLYEQPTADYFVPAGLTFNEIQQGWY